MREDDGNGGFGEVGVVVIREGVEDQRYRVVVRENVTREGVKKRVGSG